MYEAHMGNISIALDRGINYESYFCLRQLLQWEYFTTKIANNHYLSKTYRNLKNKHAFG